jgi:hypothetical protein
MSNVSQKNDILVHCPRCGSTQFAVMQKTTTMRGILFLAAFSSGMLGILLGIILVSIGAFGFLFISFFMILMIPVMSLYGYYGCKKIVNVCANCRRDF